MNKTGTHTDPSNLPMYGALLIPILLRPLSRYVCVCGMGVLQVLALTWEWGTRHSGTVRLVSTDPLLDPEIKHNFLQVRL